VRTFPVAVPAADERLLHLAIAWGARAGLGAFMRLMSRLGDGPLWYAAGTTALIAGGAPGRRLALAGVLAGTLDALIYRACKRRFVRPRPFQALPDLPLLWAPPGDFSFPSGHALHAFASATLIAAHFPALAPPAFVLAGLIALSRVFLAVHYPSDVVAGAALGALVAGGILAAL
jgi:undecaprenyl-diphosphatase